MGDLSEHFSRREFACKCGCGRDTIDAETLRLCEEVRQLNGDLAISPLSGHRCEKHNKAVGGALDSQHLYGRAADLPVVDPISVYNQLCAKYQGKYGFGCYPKRGFVHIDTRSNGPARWVRS